MKRLPSIKFKQYKHRTFRCDGHSKFYFEDKLSQCLQCHAVSGDWRKRDIFSVYRISEGLGEQSFMVLCDRCLAAHNRSASLWVPNEDVQTAIHAVRLQ